VQDFISKGEVEGERGSVMELGEEENRLINQRNMELVATLRNTDSAFSLGEGPPPHNHMCVRSGALYIELASVSEPHHFCAAPALGKTFNATLAAPAPTLQQHIAGQLLFKAKKLTIGFGLFVFYNGFQ
jgi:hypothetical protein